VSAAEGDRDLAGDLLGDLLSLSSSLMSSLRRRRLRRMDVESACGAGEPVAVGVMEAIFTPLGKGQEVGVDGKVPEGGVMGVGSRELCRYRSWSSAPVSVPTPGVQTAC